MGGLRCLWVVARNELSESVRRRRAGILLILYLAAGIAGCNLFVTGLHKVEIQLAESLGVPVSGAGSVTAALWESRPFRKLMTALIGDRELAESLLGIPPLTLFFGWLAFTFSPLLVVLMSSGSIAEEIGTGSVRFVITRVPRSTWYFGKMLGQAAVILLGIMLSAVGAWCVGRLRMASFPALTSAHTMLVLGFKAWIFSLAYLGVAVGASQMCRSAHRAIAVAFVATMVLSVLSWAAGHFVGDGVRRLWGLLEFLLPQGYRMELWNPAPAHQLPAGIILVVLGLSYSLIGYCVFVRRDL